MTSQTLVVLLSGERRLLILQWYISKWGIHETEYRSNNIFQLVLYLEQSCFFVFTETRAKFCFDGFSDLLCDKSFFVCATVTCFRPRVKRAAGSAIDVAAPPTSSHQQCSSSVASSLSAAASVTDVRFTPNLTTLWTSSDQLRQSLPFGM